MTAPQMQRDAVPEVSIRRVAHVEIRLRPQLWPFAQERRHDIDVHFTQLKAAKPALWNGRVLLFRHCRFAGATLTGEAFETDYASFLAWHAWGNPDRAVTNCFAPAAVQGSDGGFLLGRMAPHTANAGQVYFPCGTPDPADVVDGRVDFDCSARRELREETGLDAGEFDLQPGWTAISHGSRLALIKCLHSPQTTRELRVQVLRYLAQEASPEFTDIVAVHDPAGIVPAMPPFVAAFLKHVL